jgi:uncharacterized protein
MIELLRTFKAVPDLVDLAWVIGSSPLLSKTPKSSTLALGHTWCEQQLEAHIDFLMDVLHNPNPFLLYLNETPSPLLGKRFERLLSYWFHHSPSFELIAENIQFFQDKTTIGEIDFLVRDLHTHEVWHIEAACKYYFGAKNTHHHPFWIGPNGKDNLAQKWKTLHHQLSLFETRQAKLLLDQLQLPQPHTGMFLKGYFFQPLQLLGQYATPAHAHPKHNTGWFVQEDECHLLRGKIAQWHVLVHPRWLGPSFAEDHQLLSGDELVDQILSKPLKQAMLVAQVIDQTEISRGFILPQRLFVQSF